MPKDYQEVEILKTRIKQDFEMFTDERQADAITELLMNHVYGILTTYGNARELEGVEKARDIAEDRLTWYNTNNQIPEAELQKGGEYTEMLRKIVKDSLVEIQGRIDSDIAMLKTELK